MLYVLHMPNRVSKVVTDHDDLLKQSRKKNDSDNFRPRKSTLKVRKLQTAEDQK